MYVDLGLLIEQQLENIVIEHCSLFGAVSKVTIYRSPSAPLARPFAMVSMETTGETRRLAAAFGERMIGQSVIILLQHAANNCAQMSRQWLPLESDTPALDPPGSQR